MQHQSLILTATERLATYLQEERELSTAIFPLNQWLVYCWQQLPASKKYHLLTTAQTHILWQQIIDKLLHHKHASNYARLAEHAARLCRQWEVDPSTQFNLSSPSEAAQLFATGFEQFNEYCTRNKLCDQTALSQHLLPYFEARSIHLPDVIIFKGFDEFPPYLTRLIHTLDVHCTIEIDRPGDEQHADNAYRFSAQSEQEELWTAARWALAQHQSHPDYTIGCIVPRLTHCRSLVESIFKTVFNHAYRLPGSYSAAFPVNIAGGRQLAHYPPIKIALTLLKLSTASDAHFNEISDLLRSPFIADNYHNTVPLAQIDVELRQHNEMTIPFSADILPPWFKQLSTPTHLREQRLPSAWAQVFESILTTIGWPGERPLNSEDYQVVQRWHTLLNELSGFDQLTGACTYFVALDHLTDLAYNTLFQAKTDKQPVQVLGVLEAAGIHFDALWVTGMHDANWPPPAQPNPFLPITLQRTFGMPHASAARELDFCQTLTQRLQASSPIVIFSHAEQLDSQPVNVSPLIATLPIIDANCLTLASRTSPPYKIVPGIPTPPSYYIQDSHAPPVTPDEPVIGGSSVLKRQASCPFSAFAGLRLGAKRLPVPRPGLTPMERGQLIHDALDKIWQRIKTQQILHTLTPEQQQDIVIDSVQIALKKLNNIRYTPLPTHFIRLETERLNTLLHAWLTYEAKRPPFAVVAREKSYQTCLGPLLLRLCIDRIDQLADGSYIIIDYKTGKTNILKWFGDRPEAPQLPLYCITFDELPVSGATFGEIAPGKMQLRGVAEQPDQLPHVKAVHALSSSVTTATDWHNLKDHWQQTLLTLGHAFASGVAVADPKNQAATCRSCGLYTLCRQGFNYTNCNK